MKSPFKFIYLVIMLLFSCIDDDQYYKILDFEKFSLEVPMDWENFSSQGDESIVGGITNGNDELVYEYGWDSYDFQKETTATHRRIITNIDGNPALMVLPLKKGEGIIGVYIQVDNQIQFSLSGMDIKNEDRIKRMFESVRFKEAKDYTM